MPLVGLFLQLERYVAELNRPRTFKRMFDELVARRGDDYFDFYANRLDDFLGSLRDELALAGLDCESLEQLTREVFDDLRKGSRANVMTAIVRDRTGQEVAINHRRPSNSARARFAPDELVPGIAFAVPNRRWSLEPYRRTKQGDLEGLPTCGSNPTGQRESSWTTSAASTVGAIRDTASLIVDRLRTGFRRRFEMSADFYGSSKWLPKVKRWSGLTTHQDAESAPVRMRRLTRCRTVRAGGARPGKDASLEL